MYYIYEGICIVRRRRQLKKYEFVAKSLSEKIREGQFADGAFLPTEERLTQMYSVSRQTVRKALSSWLASRSGCCGIQAAACLGDCDAAPEMVSAGTDTLPLRSSSAPGKPMWFSTH